MSGPIDHRSEITTSGRYSGRLTLVTGESGAPDPRPVKILYIEDDEDDVFLLRRQLGKLAWFQAECTHAPSLEAAHASLLGQRFDLVLCDFWLGGETILPLLETARNTALRCPFVLVSSLENEDIELIGRRAGAAGFVAKADLSAEAIDRLFSTLLPFEEPRPARGKDSVSIWLKAFLQSLDRVQAVSASVLEVSESRTAEELLSKILADSLGMRGDILEKLAGLEPARRIASTPRRRFDAVPYIADAVSQLKAKALDSGRIHFTLPVLPVLIEANPPLFSDLVQGFFAEATEAVVAGRPVTIALCIKDGALCAEIESPRVETGAAPSEKDGARVLAAAKARRILVETLAQASGGQASFGEPTEAEKKRKGSLIGSLALPLRVL